MDIYDYSSATGNCYTGCAYMCFRKRRNNLVGNRLSKDSIPATPKKRDIRFADGYVPSNGYYCYCPKNPKVGFDIIQDVDDEQNLIKGLFHVSYIWNRDVGCPCFESRYETKLYSQIQNKVTEYERI